VLRSRRAHGHADGRSRVGAGDRRGLRPQALRLPAGRRGDLLVAGRPGAQGGADGDGPRARQPGRVDPGGLASHGFEAAVLDFFRPGGHRGGRSRPRLVGGEPRCQPPRAARAELPDTIRLPDGRD
jgi:hypothetical protein